MRGSSPRRRGFGRKLLDDGELGLSCATLSARPAFSNASMLSWCCFAMRRRIAVHASSETVAALSFFCSSRNAARAAAERGGTRRVLRLLCGGEGGGDVVVDPHRAEPTESGGKRQRARCGLADRRAALDSRGPGSTLRAARGVGLEERPSDADSALLAEELRDAWPRSTPWSGSRASARSRPARPRSSSSRSTRASSARSSLALPPLERQLWMRQLAPDDAADVVQEAPSEERERAAPAARRADPPRGERAPRLRRGRGRRPDEPALRAAAPGDDVDEAIAYLRRAARERVETIYYIYVLDAEQRLLGVVSFRELFAAPPDERVRDVMRTERHLGAARTSTRRRSRTSSPRTT